MKRTRESIATGSVTLSISKLRRCLIGPSSVAAARGKSFMRLNFSAPYVPRLKYASSASKATTMTITPLSWGRRLIKIGFRQLERLICQFKSLRNYKRSFRRSKKTWQTWQRPILNYWFTCMRLKMVLIWKLLLDLYACSNLKMALVHVAKMAPSYLAAALNV